MPAAQAAILKQGGVVFNPNSTYINAVVNQNDPFFNAVWNVIKSWDVNVPDAYQGYMGANGSHVQMILDAINNVKKQQAFSNAMKGIGP